MPKTCPLVAIYFAEVERPVRPLHGILGLQNFGGDLGGALAPTVTGFIVQATGNFVPALLVGAAIALASAVAYLVVNPEPAYPVGRARGSRTVAMAKWRVLVTVSARAAPKFIGLLGGGNWISRTLGLPSLTPAASP